MGDVVENEALRVQAGSYWGILRYVSNRNLVQGPLGAMAEAGDFLLEVAGVRDRSAILIHQGNKPWHSKGCILAGPATKKVVDGETLVSIGQGTTLRELRKLFYDTDAEPVTCPNKTIRISISDI